MMNIQNGLTSVVAAAVFAFSTSTNAQRPSLAGLQAQINDLRNQIAASVTCPTALPGQPRFVDNGDGTICDSVTGLMWEKKEDCGGAVDLSNPHCVANIYSVSASSSFPDLDGTLYSDFLAKLNLDQAPSLPFHTCFADHCDWRIPTITEFFTIYQKFENCDASACINPIFGPTEPAGHWSSTTVGGREGSNWVLTFNSRQDVTDRPKVFEFRSRAVRGGRR